MSHPKFSRPIYYILKVPIYVNSFLYNKKNSQRLYVSIKNNLNMNKSILSFQKYLKNFTVNFINRKITIQDVRIVNLQSLITFRINLK